MAEPSFTMGIEEEYLLVDGQTFDLAPAPKGLMTACRDALGDQVSPEFLQCQIEVGTRVCATIADARADLSTLRRTVARIAGDYGLAPIAASTHPFAKWDDQIFTDRARYRDLEADLAGVARRMLICGMHVHVGIEDEDQRIDLLNQASYFLPHLLALSASSPFWEGRKTGLHCYRLSVFDNMPRTGLPPRFSSFAEFRRSVDTFVQCGVIEDASKLWWDLRPSDHYPTLESRICDVSPRLEDALTIAAVTQSLFRMLHRLGAQNMRWRLYDRFLIEENRWRAQRYGADGDLIDFGAGRTVPFADLADELVDLLRMDAQALGCLPEVKRAADIARTGTSAARQVAAFDQAVKGGATDTDALRVVVKDLAAEFSDGL